MKKRGIPRPKIKQTGETMEIIDFTKIIKEIESGEDLYDFKGNLIRKSELPAIKKGQKKVIPFDLKLISIRALNVGLENKSIPGEEKYKRFQFIQKIMENPRVVKLSPEEQAMLKKHIGEVFTLAAIVGQAWDILDPKKEIGEK